MTLRIRLLVVLVGMVTAGLVVTDFVTYTQLRSFLLARIDPQLRGTSFAVSRALEVQAGLRPALVPGPPSGTGSTGSTGTGSTGTGSTGTGTSTGGPRSGLAVRHGQPGAPFGSGARGQATSFGEFGELVDRTGTIVGKPLPSLFGGRTPPAPVLPRPLPDIGSSGYQIFDASSRGADAVTYRVLIRPVHDVARDRTTGTGTTGTTGTGTTGTGTTTGTDNTTGSAGKTRKTGEQVESGGLTEVVAVPLTDVDDTLGRLLAIELAVSGGVLLALAALAWVVVRRGLRPLQHMGDAAGHIAAGDLTRRVAPAGGRTEVGRLGLALNAMLAEIESAFAARAASEERLRRFLADASHELRTPLTSIRGYAELFDLGARSRPADLEASMHHIRDEAARMGVMVDDLLLLARLDEERPLLRQPVDLAELVRRSVDARRAAEPDHHFGIEVPETCEAECDELRIRQVVDNLLVNAIRHSPPEAVVEVRLHPDEGHVVLEVADHGPGVPPDQRVRIFEPFFRPDASRQRGTGGAGLGLAIVASIARAHGGTAGVGSTPGGGATFWVWLPIGPVAPGAERPGADRSSAGGQGNQGSSSA